MSLFWQILEQPFGILWRTALLRLPRAVPDAVLRITSPKGPHPFVIKLPSRGKYLIPVYVFAPPDIASGCQVPVILDFHGGGFVFGSCLEQAPFCAQLSRELRAIVLSVDYRMGPISKFPAALEDGEDVLWAILDSAKPGYKELRAGISDRVLEYAARTNSPNHDLPNTAGEPIFQIDKARIAISGFSSGGNLALNLALHVPAVDPFIANDWPHPFPADHAHPLPILLFYPSFDVRQLPSERARPAGMSKNKSFLGSLVEYIVPSYLPRDQAAHPRASPGLVNVKEGLHAKAKILLVLPEKDSLSEQSEIWVKKVEEEGRSSDLTVNRYPGMSHGWTQMPESWLSEHERSAREESFRVAISFVRDLWNTSREEEAAKDTSTHC